MGLFARKKTPSRPVPRRRLVAAQQPKKDEGRYSSTQFRRGRTLPGTTAARLHAHDSRAIKTATPREKVRHLSYVRRKLAGALGLLVLLSLVLAILLWQFTATASVGTTESSVVPQNELVEYEKSLQKYFADNPMERLRFNLNAQRLNEFMIRKHPEIYAIEQHGATAFTTTAFTVQLRKPVVSWQVDTARYFVDAQGVSFTKNIFDMPAVTIVDNSGVRHTPGTAIASARFLSFVGRAVALAQQNKLVVKQVNIPAGTSRQVELIIDGIAYPFILSIDRLPGEQVEDVLRVIAYFNRVGGIPPHYVDLRVKGKAFYRL